MLKRIPVSAALAGLALTGALCGCANATHNVSAGVGSGATLTPPNTSPAKPSSPAHPSSPAATPSPSHVSSPPAIGGPIIFAVRLGSSFQPNTLRLSPGQQFEVIVESSVKASGPGLPGSCNGSTATVYGGMLTVRCASGDFYYTAQRPGTADLMATVRPRCSPGVMCPQWIAEATLKITIL